VGSVVTVSMTKKDSEFDPDIKKDSDIKKIHRHQTYIRV
jgi:hypothetical protein